MNGQAEIPEVPPVGYLKRLRALLPFAERVFSFAKAVDNSLEKSDGIVAPADSRAVATMGRNAVKRMDALGLPIKRVKNAADFPDGTRHVAVASKQFWTALEVAGSLVVAVNEREEALLPRDFRTGEPL